MDITDKSVIKWQRLQIKNLEDEILRLKTNLEGSEAVLKESTKEYIDEIVSKTDTIHELKNTIERQELMIDKMKKIIITAAYEIDFNPCFSCKNIDYNKISRCKINGCSRFDKWTLKEE